MGCGSSSEAPESSLSHNKSARLIRNLSVPAGSEFVGVLVVTVAEARGLVGNDVGGSADPFVTVAFGKGTFKTKHVPKSLTPVWNQRTAIPITTSEQAYSLVCNIWDRDGVSANDFCGVCTVPIKSFLDGKPSDQWYPVWSHAEAGTVGRHQTGELRLKVDLQTQQEIEQQFWAQLLKLFDYDESGAISRLEFAALLEALGSTLTDSAIDKLFQQGDQNQDQNIDAEEIQLLMARPEAREEFGGMKSCPICQHVFVDQSEVIVHLGGCLQADGSADDFLASGFLTNKDAAKGWVAKLSEWVNFGDYGLGANSGNILVVNRATGAVEEEKIPPFVRTSIRLLYQKSSSAAKVQKLLKAMTLKMGKRYNDPKSKKEIMPFIKFHELNVDEILDPLDSFNNFNEFFYRKLRSDARPIASPDDPNVAVSPADCRLNAFAHVDDATRLWVKGKEFSVKSLLRDDALAAKFEGGSLAIFRLAPQDYHRFHVPVTGVLGKPRALEGAFYTVSPMAVRGSVNVFTENTRCVTTIDSPQFGLVGYVCVGATMVGSIVLTSQEGSTVHKGDEHGYFQFGGSTVILLFEPGAIKFDDDLVAHSLSSTETLVKMGVQVGRSTRTIPVAAADDHHPADSTSDAAE